MKYIDELMHTLSLQKREVQGFELKILNNIDKDYTIGKAFNKLADECNTDWILYIGDDDIISADYIDDIFRAYYKRQWQFKKVVGIVTGCMVWDDNLPVVFTFLWPSYLMVIQALPTPSMQLFPPLHQ